MRLRILTDTSHPDTGETLPAALVLDVEPAPAKALVEAGAAERTRDELTVDVGAVMAAYFDRHPPEDHRPAGPHA